MRAAVPALLLGLAVAVATARLPRRVLQASPGPGAESVRRPPLPLAVVGAVGTALLVGGALGLVLGTAVAVVAPRALRRAAEASARAAAQEALAADLPLALDLLAACLSGGASAEVALLAVGDALPGPCADRLLRVRSALLVGTPPAEAWRALGDDRGTAGAAARALARAADSGAPVAEAVRRVAQDARRDARSVAEQRARRVGVQAVGPLGACFLPAFFLLGVVPAVVGLALPLLHSL